MKYEIKGETMPVVICEVDAGETVVCESGSMSWMTPNMEMQTSEKRSRNDCVRLIVPRENHSCGNHPL